MNTDERDYVSDVITSYQKGNSAHVIALGLKISERTVNAILAHAGEIPSAKPIAKDTKADYLVRINSYVRMELPSLMKADKKDLQALAKALAASVFF